jgi:exodeoxyribonuclease V beta subunit
VQVLTIHRSKGLEFPVVYFPFLWEPFPERKGEPVTFHDPGAADALTVDVGLEGAEFRRHAQQHQAEQRGEELRLAYVALTRAQHQAVLWWAGSYDTRDSALTRLLFSRDAEGTVAASGDKTPTDAEARKRFEALAAAAPGCISVEESVLGMPVAWSSALEPPAALAALTFDRRLDRGWRRTSYSDITAGSHEARVASEPEEPVVDDEPDAAEGAAAGAAPRDGGAPLPLAGAPAGTAFGTFVHDVLEAADFAAPELTAELVARVTEVQARRQVDIGEPSLVVAGLRAAIETPLLDGLRLRDVARADRLDELAFELPLAGGDQPTGVLEPATIAAVLREHLAEDDPLSGYARRLEDPALRPSVRGYLTGSIDLVMRVGERFAIADYKTNWLGAPGEPLTASHYRHAALTAEMERSHYALQALLYTVALHRYLRWRIPAYDPRVNLGGVYYLFVRGMTGAQGDPVAGAMPAGSPGVFAWHPSGELVEALSEALA